MALSRAERFMLLRAAVLLPVFWLGLRLLGLSRFQALIGGAAPAARGSLPLPQVQALGRVVNLAASRMLRPGNCLVRSLLLHWLLQRRGLASHLRIGVRLTDGTLDAHAWVECCGVPVNDSAEVATQFAAFGELVPLQAFNAP